MTIGVGAQSLSDLFLARHLTSEDYGFFTLIFRDAVTVLSTIILLGSDTSLIRFLGRTRIEEFRWKPFLLTTVKAFAVVSVLLGAIVTLIYELPPWNIPAIAAIVTMLAGVNLFSTVLRTREQITRAQVGLHSWRLVFAMLVVPLYLTGLLSVKTLAVLIGISLSCSVVVLGWSLHRIPQGKQAVPFRPLLTDGILFFGLSTSSLLMLRLERFFLGGLESLSDVAGYYAVSLPVLTLYWILSSGAAYVILPQFAKGVELSLRSALAFLLGAGILIGIPFLLFGHDLVVMLFNGRYQEYSFLIPWFVIMGIIQLLYVLPSSLIGGRSTTEQLSRFVYFGIASLAINIILCLLLIPSVGIMGAALANIGSWVFRCGAAFWFSGRVLRPVANTPLP
jgi:O-antigen/teichoic acid export membrane protein